MQYFSRRAFLQNGTLVLDASGKPLAKAPYPRLGAGPRQSAGLDKAMAIQFRHRSLRTELKCAAGHWLIACATVALFTLATVLLARMLDKPWVWDTDGITILDVLPVNGNKAAILFATFSADGKGDSSLVTHIGIQSIELTHTDVRMAWPLLRPSCLATCPRIGAIFIGDWSGSIRVGTLSDLNGATTLLGCQDDGAVEALACSSDGQVVLSKGARFLCAWSVVRGAALWRRDDLGIMCFAVHPRASIAVCGTIDGRLIELDLASGNVIRTLPRHVFPLMTVLFNHTGDQLASIASGGVIALTRWHDLMPVWNQQEDGLRMAYSRFAAFSPDDQHLITSADNDMQALTVWRVSDGKHLGTLRGHTAPVVGVTFLEDGSLCSGDTDGMVRTWDVETLTASSVAHITVAASENALTCTR